MSDTTSSDNLKLTLGEDRPGASLDLPAAPRAQASAMDWAKVVILLGLAGFLTVNLITGNLANYINMRYEWLQYVAIALSLALGLGTLGAILRGEGSNRTSDHSVITWPILLVMALPLVIAASVPAQPLSAGAARNGGVSLTTTSLTLGQSVTRDPMERNVLDWLRLFSQSAAPSRYDGERASFIGFIYTEPDFPDNTVMVARFAVSCCVADASALGIPVYWPEAAALSDNEWVRVEGAFEAGLFRDVKTPILQADVLTVIEQPEHPYLYP